MGTLIPRARRPDLEARFAIAGGQSRRSGWRRHRYGSERRCPRSWNTFDFL